MSKSNNKKFTDFILKYRLINLFAAGALGLIIAWFVSIESISDFLKCFFNEDLFKYISTFFAGVPVFLLLWYFRTHDTKTGLIQSKFFNALDNLSSESQLKIEVGVFQLKKIRENNPKDEDIRNQIQLSFIKRLKAKPEGVKNTDVLGYAQHIFQYLKEDIEKSGKDEKIDLNYCKLDNQEFTCEGIDEVLQFFFNEKKRDSERIKIQITNISLKNTDLTGVDLANVDLTGVSGQFKGKPANIPTPWKIVNQYLIGPRANLSGVNLAGADLINTNLVGANLAGANLTDANLRGVDFTGANLTDADFKNTIVSKSQRPYIVKCEKSMKNAVIIWVS
jgi:uncharacterized protein YjbI with pentapeptide repeats